MSIVIAAGEIPRLYGLADEYWFELGARTCYHCYVGFTELIEGCGLRAEVQQRGKTHLRFLDGDRFYGRIVGKRNFANELGPMLSAVPSQSADAFPAGMLFKIRDTRGKAGLEDLVEKRTVLPSPALGHEKVVAEIDRLSAGRMLCVLGNWFAGLSIEDCVDRSRTEWARVAAAGQSVRWRAPPPRAVPRCPPGWARRRRRGGA